MVSKAMGTQDCPTSECGWRKAEGRDRGWSPGLYGHTRVQRSSRETSGFDKPTREEGDQENAALLKLREEFALLDSDQCY